MKTLHKGFTLVELLVVISIIGILLTIVIASYSTAQKKTRDARRKSDMHAIQAAFEQLYGETGSYLSGSPATCQVPLSSASTTFFPIAPTDPKTGAYAPTCSDSTHYCLCAALESDTGNAVTDCATPPNSGKFQCIRNQQ